MRMARHAWLRKSLALTSDGWSSTLATSSTKKKAHPNGYRFLSKVCLARLRSLSTSPVLLATSWRIIGLLTKNRALDPSFLIRGCKIVWLPWFGVLSRSSEDGPTCRFSPGARTFSFWTRLLKSSYRNSLSGGKRTKSLTFVRKSPWSSKMLLPFTYLEVRSKQKKPSCSLDKKMVKLLKNPKKCSKPWILAWWLPVNAYLDVSFLVIMQSRLGLSNLLGIGMQCVQWWTNSLLRAKSSLKSKETKRRTQRAS